MREKKKRLLSYLMTNTTQTTTPSRPYMFPRRQEYVNDLQLYLIESTSKKKKHDT